MFDFHALNFDMDGDGVLDSYGEEIDTDGDGAADGFAVDLNNDGIADVTYVDTDGNGVMDMCVMQFDSSGDGVIDTVRQFYDYNQDGMWDSMAMFQDYDHDGIFDAVMKGHDSTGDGQMDTFKTYLDYNGDGNPDEIFDEALINPDGSFQSVAYAAGVCVDDLENFNPAEADPDAVYGDPARSMQEWEYQGDTGRCALYSQKFVIEELTGQEVDMEELADFAEQNGWFAEESGTTFLNMNKVLDYYGVDNRMSFHNSMDDIQDCLESGGKVIVSIDADEIWYGESGDLFTPGDCANHAVEVIGIDYSNPDEPMVILNDSGNPDGCGEMVPVEAFVDAWEDGNCQMIACM